MKERILVKRLLTLCLTAALGLAVVAGPVAVAGASPATIATSARGVIPAAPGWPSVSTTDFVTTIDNPWFPLKVGSSWVSRGIKDGKQTMDTFTVTAKTKTILGVPCTVVRDVLKQHGQVVEATWDWYAQDKQGNVWYFGENTRDYNAAGKVISTAGTWKAGVKGARPGIFMPAAPQVGKGGYQEYLKGQALDRYKVTSFSGSITVPYGSFTNALVTRETTVLEPAVVDQKLYVKGLGQVAERSLKGPKETSFLVSYTK
jgi:hypothetical protein